MERTCLRCGWVHFGIPRAKAEEEVKRFNDYFDAANAETQLTFGNHSACIAKYEKCSQCGAPYTRFRDAVAGDAPAGVTIAFDRGAAARSIGRGRIIDSPDRLVGLRILDHLAYVTALQDCCVMKGRFVLLSRAKCNGRRAGLCK